MELTGSKKLKRERTFSDVQTPKKRITDARAIAARKIKTRHGSFSCSEPSNPGLGSQRKTLGSHTGRGIKNKLTPLPRSPLHTSLPFQFTVKRLSSLTNKVKGMINDGWCVARSRPGGRE